VRSTDRNDCRRIRRRVSDIADATPRKRAVGHTAAEGITIERACFVRFSGDDATVGVVTALKEVNYVAPDDLVRAQRRQKRDTHGPPPSWGLDRIDQTNLPLGDQPYAPPHSGANVNIYVFDSGINAAHVEFSGRAEDGASFVESEPEPVDLAGHGTHCAGIAAGRTLGVAPGATVISVKVLDRTGAGRLTSLLKGLEWAAREQELRQPGRPGVVSMSLGGPKNKALDEAVKAAANELVVVVSAGNNADNACKFSPARIGGKGHRTGLITVGATDRSDQRSTFSNFGSCVDLFAPGTGIPSAWIGSRRARRIESGTSMAAPHVAGAVAVLLGKHSFSRDAALEELFDSALRDFVTSPGKRSPNLLLHVSSYTGPPTPRATPRPTLTPPTICVGGFCADFAESLFGPSWPRELIQEGSLVAVRGSDPNGCSTLTKRDGKYQKNDIVMIFGSGCQYFDKVYFASQAGAGGVVVARATPGPIFPPNYLGHLTVKVPSMMIAYQDGLEFAEHFGELVTVGSPSLRPQPSAAPTTIRQDPPPGNPQRRRRHRRRRRHHLRQLLGRKAADADIIWVGNVSRKSIST